MRSNKAIDVNNAQIKNVAAPTDGQDVATKAYVDVAVATGGTGDPGSGTDLVSYSVQVATLNDYPDTFPTTSDDITDATTTGKSLIKATDSTAVKNAAGLGSVDNTPDASKPVSNAQQAALNLKADAANPTFTGTVTGVTQGMVGLANVDNTHDIDKPVSTATQTVLDTKVDFIPGMAVAVFRTGSPADWPSTRPTTNPLITILAVGQTPGPTWMTQADVLLDLSIINNDIYLLPSDTLLPADNLQLKG